MFVFNLLLAALLGYLLGLLYARYGTSLSNRKLFGRNFVQLTMTTMLIITVVKSSLALSLGLVGALSIVRFRAAIKEPEELTYLFLAIGVGLGLGADQRLVTLVAFAMIAVTVIVKGMSQIAEESENLHLTITSRNPHKVELDQIVDTLKQHCTALKMKRFDDSREILEASFLVEFSNLAELQASTNDLQRLGESVNISFLDTKGLI